MRYVLATLTAISLGAALPAKAQNLALNQSTFISGTSFSPFATPERAVDGNTNGSYGLGSTYHSGESNSAWWYVDLGQVYEINQINFWNRTDCCGQRIIGATIGIFDAAPYGDGGPTALWSMVFASGAAQQVFTAPSVDGRYVGILAPSSGDSWLQIAEVEVFGERPQLGVVPEPASVALVGGGLLALGAVVRRRRMR